MHHLASITEGELPRTSPQISLFIPIRAHVPIRRGYQSETSDIEFSSFIEKRIRDVSLHNIRSFFPWEKNHRVANDFSDRLQIWTNLDSKTSVSVLSRLNNPVSASLLAFFFIFLIGLNEANIFFISNAFSKMEGNWHILKDVLSDCSVVLS